MIFLFLFLKTYFCTWGHTFGIFGNWNFSLKGAKTFKIRLKRGKNIQNPSLKGAKTFKICLKKGQKRSKFVLKRGQKHSKFVL